MLSTDRTFLRLHVEAVWGVQLSSLECDELTLLPASSRPAWKLYTARIASGSVFIWRPDVESGEREALLTRLGEAQSLPVDRPLPPGVSREVAFRLADAPVIPSATARQTARLLTPDDYALLDGFEPGEAGYYLQVERRPVAGVVVDGRLLCVAHSSRRTAEACELGIDTLPEARRRGYALAATIAWSEAVQREGLTPIYSALASNVASLNLAVAAGYREFARAITVE